MSAPKAGTYVLLSTAYYRTEGEGDEAVRKRYKRGDRVELSKSEAARLAVPTRLAPAAFAKPSDDVDVAGGYDLVTSPAPTVNRVSEANQLVAEGNSGVFTAPASAGALTEEQLADNTAVAGYPPVTGAGAGDLVPTGDLGATTPEGAGGPDGPPARSALVEVWRDYAVKVGAVEADKAGDMTKPQLQQAVADHEARTAQ